MENSFSMVRFEAVKTNYSFKKRLQHNLRMYQDNRIINFNCGYKYIDLEHKKIETITGIKNEKSKKIFSNIDNLEEYEKEHKELKGNKYRKAKHTSIAEGIIGFSKGINEDYEANPTEFFKRVFDFFEEFEELHQTKILNCVFHNDEEGNYHIHFFAKNYNRNNGESLNLPKQSANNILNQDLISKHFESFGQGYKRGIRKSKAKNLNVEEFKKKMDLMEKEIKKIKTEKTELEIENIKLKSTNKELKEINEILLSKNENLNKEIKKLMAKRENLETSYIKDILGIIEQLEELKGANDMNKFLDLVYRYSKDAGRDKLDNLISKYKNGLQKVERRTEERQKTTKKTF